MYVCIPDSKVQDSGFQKQKFPGLIFRNLHSLSKRWHLFCVTRALMCIYNFLAKNCWSFYWLSSRLGFHSKTTSMLKLMSIFIKKCATTSQTWHVTITASLSANHIGSHRTHDNNLRQNRRLALDIWTSSCGEETQCKDIELINSVSISSTSRTQHESLFTCKQTCFNRCCVGFSCLTSVTQFNGKRINRQIASLRLGCILIFVSI